MSTIPKEIVIDGQIYTISKPYENIATQYETFKQERSIDTERILYPKDLLEYMIHTNELLRRDLLAERKHVSDLQEHITNITHTVSILADQIAEMNKYITDVQSSPSAQSVPNACDIRAQQEATDYELAKRLQEEMNK
jgi:hypothetical protein